jgi:hypothetical protein
MLTSVENYVIIIHIFMYLIFFKHGRFFFKKDFYTYHRPMFVLSLLIHYGSLL